ncbi:MAG: hypothetical protein LIQ26_04940 [Bacteroidota bacterium]|nr:hypothetical protein [Bacteroidota bacterium]
MPLIGNNKPTLLRQVEHQPAVEVQQLVQLINTYEDLQIEDFRGIISDFMYKQLLDAVRKPEEVQMWNEIQAAPRNTPADIQALQGQLSMYIQRFAKSPKIDEAQEMMNQLPMELQQAVRRKQIEENMAREKKDWENLERGNYLRLSEYRQRYPESAHLEEIDDLMWTNTKNAISAHSLSRYLNDWPSGRHVQEAQQALAAIGEWEDVKHSGDLFRVDDYKDNNPNSPFIAEVTSLYYKLRDEELTKMKANPSEYSKDDVERLISADIFDRWQLIDEELMTDESWETLQLDRDLFPNIQDYQVEDPNIKAPEGCTDIYLFGTPGTGKTCLLMGLSGATGVKDAKGQSYTINYKVQGGPYASALQQYVEAGITPGRTYGKFVTAINGNITEVDRRGRSIDHRINLVEMSGEEFALRIADSREVSLSDMGTGATNLLMNDNRKVFFIIVDSSKDRIKVEYIEQIKDADGNVIDERIRKRYISQLDILNKFVGLFELPENQKIMSKVDAIHFIVTKADTLGDKTVRKEKARDLLLSKYASPIEQLKNFCNRTRRINYSTNYRPQAYTFSLGRFYLGDVFDFDMTETTQIIDTIRSVTGGNKATGFWERLKKFLG